MTQFEVPGVEEVEVPVEQIMQCAPDAHNTSVVAVGQIWQVSVVESW